MDERKGIQPLAIERNLQNEEDFEQNALLFGALSSPLRLKILKLLTRSNLTVSEVAAACDITVSAATFHLRELQRGGLVAIEFLPSKKGKVQVCMQQVESLYFFFSGRNADENERGVTLSMPVGHYTDIGLQFVSGMCTPDRQILFDDGNFFRPERMDAMLLWGKSGFVEYTFSSPTDFTSLKLSLELCSETLGWQYGWKSDITFSLNGVRLCTHLSEADYGNRRGVLNPPWWPKNNSSQYGKLVEITVDNKGAVSLDGKTVNALSPSELSRVTASRRLVLRIENADDAEHKGGFNLFGRGFGDHPQDIELTLYK